METYEVEIYIGEWLVVIEVEADSPEEAMTKAEDMRVSVRGARKV
jgi:hypothetical protein